MSKKDNRVLIFDTTLRDGEQAGHKMDPATKLSVARLLAEFGVDVIEAGFPASPGDDVGVSKIASAIRGPIICALARTMPSDVVAAARALEQATRPRIHVFVATSDVHVQKKLRVTQDVVLEMIRSQVRLAKSYCDDVEYSPEDAARTSPEFLAQAVRIAIGEGARTINIPDTVGIAAPWEFEDRIKNLYEAVPELREVILSVHCHNDLAMAVANTLAGVRAGARQVEGCFLGIGERAGNAMLEPIIVALKLKLGMDTGVVWEKLCITSRMIARTIGLPIPEHYPLVGEQAFAHSSGIHADGVIKDPSTYEIIQPESIGWDGKTVKLVSHLGRSGIRDYYLKELGAAFTDVELEAVHSRYMEVANLKLELSNEDLVMILQEVRTAQEAVKKDLYRLTEISYDRVGNERASARITLACNELAVVTSGKGDGAIDAVDQAILHALLGHGEEMSRLALVDYKVLKGEQQTSSANAWVFAAVCLDGRIGYGRAQNTDVVIASAHAFISAINNLIFGQ
ncbi:MAG: hypothetical protein A3G04_04005 [Candidatus Taylorbacteria bacterium RIFCSPLOWO2_12_FULL_44_9]|nr:MAG: hypothetical protein A3G04_04005 [Candidatus Taylorbacteria bacterium RIFCSPLOWO2_12_FULL_44_9]